MRGRLLLATVLIGLAGVTGADEKAAPRGDSAPVWSADGFHIAFKRGSAIYRASSDDLAYEKIYEAGEGRDVGPPSWDPSGKTLLVTEFAAEPPSGVIRYAVKVVDAVSGEISEVVSASCRASAAAAGAAQWLRAGRSVAYLNVVDGTTQIVVRDVGGGDPRRIAADEDLCTFAASPNGSHVAYGVATAADRGAIFLVDAGADAEARILWNMRPAWTLWGPAQSLKWSVGGNRLVAAVIDAADISQVRRRPAIGVRMFDVTDDSERSLFAGDPPLEFYWRKDDGAIWLLSEQSAVGPTPLRRRILSEVAIDGARRTVTDGNIVRVAGGLAPDGNVAFVLRDFAGMHMSTDLQVQEEGPDCGPVKLVVSFGGMAPVVIASQATYPSWSPRGNKIAFRIAASTLGGRAVDAVGIAFVSSSRVEYLTFNFEEELWRADQFYLNHNHGDALETYERLEPRVAAQDATALDVRMMLARERTSAAPGEQASLELRMRLLSLPVECAIAVDAFSALLEYRRGLEFFGELASKAAVNERALLRANLALFDLNWSSGLFDRADELFLQRILPTYRRVLADSRARTTPFAYEPAVLRCLKRVVDVFPERLQREYKAEDLTGLIAEILSLYPELAQEQRREALILAARIHTLRDAKHMALLQWIKLLELSQTPVERDRLWQQVMELDLKVEVK